MDVINKLYSTVSHSVSTTVSQLSGVLPGNPVTREYEVCGQVCSAGIGLLWKVYDGHKKSTKQEVSVFVFEKKQLEKWPKDDREIMFDLLKRGVQQLTKIRHPHVLTVQHPLEESRDSLAFATEPVFSSLANLLNKNQNDDSDNEVLYDVEIKHGILQLSEGLTFLHSDMKIIHRNLCPESIIINKQGSWKIFGFDFCVASQQTQDDKLFWPHQEYNSSLHTLTQPYLEYTAPEAALNSVNTPNSDLFSLGVLMYAIYSNGKPIKLFGKDYGSFRRFANDLNQGKYPHLTNIPQKLSNFVKSLLHASPDHRPKIHELSKMDFFDDVGVKTLNYLDSIYQWNNLQKSKFYKGLPQIIPMLPHRVNLQSVLPCLVKEFVNASMIPFVLPNVLLISEGCTKTEFVQKVFPHLKPIMKLQEPIQILLIFMNKIDLVLKLTPSDEVKVDVLPMLYRALECDMVQLQELCLGILPTLSGSMDYNAMKNALLPRIKKLCLNSAKVSVKVNCLVCIGKLLDDLDKWLVLDEILPFLSQIQCREPSVLMAIFGIFKIIMTNSKIGISNEVLATKIIPFLMPLCIESGLSLAQFNSMMALVKSMVSRVESEHKAKLEQLSTISKENGFLDTAEAFAKELVEDSKPPLQEDLFASVKTSSESNQKLPFSSGEKQQPIDQKPMSAFIKPDLLSNMVSTNQMKPMQSNNNVVQTMKPDFNFPKSNKTAIMGSFIPTGSTGIPISKNANQQAIQGSFNNANSLTSLDPFGQMKATNKVPMNQMTNGNLFDVGSTISTTPLLRSESLNQKNNNTNINTLSQQDILYFLK